MILKLGSLLSLLLLNREKLCYYNLGYGGSGWTHINVIIYVMINILCGKVSLRKQYHL